MKLGAAAVLVAGLAVGGQAARAQALPEGPAPQQSAAIPDSPRPQTLPDISAVTPGKGASGSNDPGTNDDPNAVPSTLPGSAASISSPVPEDTTAPDIDTVTGAGSRVAGLTVRVQTNFVEVPFTVKDKKGQLVPGLTWRDVRVYENGTRRQLRLFTVDPYPISAAFVIDQSVPYQVMNQVNASLGSVQGAFTPYDEAAVFTYNNGTSLKTDYTGAQSARLAAVLEQSKGTGRESNLGTIGGGPLNQNIAYNDGANSHIDPNTNVYHGTRSAGAAYSPEKEQHPLYDAIFEAAKSLQNRPTGRRRLIYVVSDGKEHGSTVKYKELVQFLQTNRIAVYATVVGESATPYVGFLDKYHIPYTMKENVLPQLASATGGETVHEFRVKGIEESFAKIAEEVRVQYTAGYYSNEPLTDGKYRTLEVLVLRPGLDVIAKKGYYPSPEALRPAAGR